MPQREFGRAGSGPGEISEIEVYDSVGFREVGVREKLGRLRGRWRDVVLLERRSERVGVD